ncbi:MAG: VWA domain-containing protein [Kineosporiaceae bacterium]
MLRTPALVAAAALLAAAPAAAAAPAGGRGLSAGTAATSADTAEPGSATATATVTPAPATSAQGPSPPSEVPGALLLILDASGSMKEPDGAGGTRIETAKDALVRLVDSLPAETAVGLRVFGHRVPSRDKPQACQDTENVVPVAAGDLDRLRSRIATTQALGETPLGLSLEQGAADLPDDRRGAMVVVSDGLDECFDDGLGPPPCDVADQLGRNGVRVEVVGLQVEPDGQRQLRCIAEATGGRFINVSDVEDLGAELTAAQQRAQNSFEARGTAVDGGPSLIDAQELEVGSYSDGIRNDDIRWYSLRANEGDAMTARLTIATGEEVPEGAGVQITWNDENAREVAREVLGTTGRGQAATFAVSTGVLDGEALTSGAVLDAGPYYLSVEIVGFPGEVEHPFVLDVVQDQVAVPTPTPSASAAAAEADAAADQAATDLPPAPPDLTGLYLILAALGLGAAALLLYRRYRSRGEKEEEPAYE